MDRPTLIGTVNGISFFEDPELGDEGPLLVKYKGVVVLDYLETNETGEVELELISKPFEISTELLLILAIVILIIVAGVMFFLFYVKKRDKYKQKKLA